MQFCKPHWNDLRKAIDDRGLSGLVAGSGEKACAALVRQLEGTDDKSDFDPLMNANWAIHMAALEDGGLYLLGTDENGNDYCPLCEAEKHGPPDIVADWINGCCDAQLETARELGLVPSKSLVN